MTPEERRVYLLMYQMAAQRIIPRYFNATCCLNGTRVAMLALAEWGIEVQPQPVDVQAMNAAFWDLFQRREEPGSPAWKEKGAFAMSVDTETESPERWPGHMVGIVDEFIIDSSSGQFSRPDRGIEVDAVSVIPIQDWPSYIGNASGAVLRYEKLDRDDYERTRGFQVTPENMEVAEQVIAVMRMMEKKARAVH